MPIDTDNYIYAITHIYLDLTLNRKTRIVHEHWFTLSSHLDTRQRARQHRAFLWRGTAAPPAAQQRGTEKLRRCKTVGAKKQTQQTHKRTGRDGMMVRAKWFMEHADLGHLWDMNILQTTTRMPAPWPMISTDFACDRKICEDRCSWICYVPTTLTPWRCRESVAGLKF